MKTEQFSTDFNSRVQNLRMVTGRSQAAMAEALAVSRTTLHYYCTGQSEPKPAVWFRLEQAERLARVGTEFSDHPLTEEPVLFADERPRTEIELTRHLHWLQGARLRQQEVALDAQRHLHEIEGWVRQTEAELARVREASIRPAVMGSGGTHPGTTFSVTAGSGPGPRRPGKRKEARDPLRDIDTVSLPIFGALPAGWPQTREGVAGRRPTRVVPVARGRFPEGVFGLEVRGDSMNAARPVAILDRDIVVLLPPELRPARHDDIVAALIDGETCLKRLKMRRRAAFLQSESTNPAHGTLHPTHDLVIQGVFVGKL